MSPDSTHAVHFLDSVLYRWVMEEWRESPNLLSHEEDRHWVICSVILF